MRSPRPPEGAHAPASGGKRREAALGGEDTSLGHAARKSPRPPAIAARALNSYYDGRFRKTAIKLLPGEFHVATDDVILVTVLGSCVSACIRDVRLAIGGMNHFMLPDDSSCSPAAGEQARYGAYAMEVLLNQLMKLGARREHLEAKVFGGGRVMAGMTQTSVGERNAEFVLDFLHQEGIPVAGQDLLDIYPRKIYYFPVTGRVLVRKLKHVHNDTIFERERTYGLLLRRDNAEGKIELFR